MTTLEDKTRNYEVAIGNLIREKEIARYDAATLATENMMLRASITALLDAIEVLGVAEYMEDGVVQQALVALYEADQSPAQEGAGDAS